MRSRFMDNHSILSRANLLTNFTLISRRVCMLSFIVILYPLLFISLIATDWAGVHVVLPKYYVGFISRCVITYTNNQSFQNITSLFSEEGKRTKYHIKQFISIEDSETYYCVLYVCVPSKHSWFCMVLGRIHKNSLVIPHELLQCVRIC